MRTLALALVLAGCSHVSSTETGAPDAGTPDAPQPTPPIGDIQMNDLSVLLPLPTTAAELAALPSASMPGPKGAILPEALFDNDQFSLTRDYDTMRVVAFRFDPCFANLGPIIDPAGCDNQLRIVFQPVTLAGGVMTAADAAIHVAYSITRAQLVTAVNAIAAARELTTRTDLGPLAVHPIVAAQGLTGAMAQQLTAILGEYANADKIERITFLSVPATVGIGGTGVNVEWVLDGYDVVLGTPTPLSIATLGSATEANLNARVLPLEGDAEPPTHSTDDIAVLVSAEQAMEATTAARQAAYDSALRIENPTTNSANTIDCTSCHMAEPARRLVGEPLFALSSAANPNAFAADPSIPAANLVTTTELVNPDKILDIHAFSYRGTAPMINQRVVNETAANLAYLRTLP